ncbi:PREDICTED: phospholipase A2 inhibitor subunit gamma B-like [Gekko japonicus]|uniref:Phospholipase A2 inhibitor subunit gamma B-like n=1 Tax=Gekko japonicus TaxID=146911 RepID=A0ABM1JQ79_GEKJA|nr:PREDICTED: phospholipase A2 inhibitor subunit gamma B-like [Gekko japonicus]
MEILPRLFVFSVLLATGSFLECEVCSSPGSNCIGERERCNANEDTCSIISIENSLEDLTVQTVAKDCEFSESCMTPGKSMNMGRGRTIQTYSICCIEDSCAVETPKMVPMENATNGIQCPACFSTNGSCVTEKTACSGDENYCFEMVSSTKVGGKVIEATMKGCATRHICKAIEERQASPLRGSGLSLKHGSCDPSASGGSQTTGLLFPAFSGLLLMKMTL